MNNPNPIPTRVFERLYRTALRLERQWDNVELSHLFVPCRIQDTWNLLTRSGIDMTWSEDRRADNAERLLRDVWKRNASRDSIRQTKLREAGKRLPSVSLSTPGIENLEALRVPFESSRSQDPWEDALFHDLAATLRRRGRCLRHIWGFFWREAGAEEWEDVARLLALRLDVHEKATTLRQWPRRHFQQIRADLRILLAEEGGAPPPTPTASRPPVLPQVEENERGDRQPRGGGAAATARRPAGSARTVLAGRPYLHRPLKSAAATQNRVTRSK